MSRAFLASPDTADTFLAQNWTAEASRIPSADAWEEEEEEERKKHESIWKPHNEK